MKVMLWWLALHNRYKRTYWTGWTCSVLRHTARSISLIIRFVTSPSLSGVPGYYHWCRAASCPFQFFAVCIPSLSLPHRLLRDLPHAAWQLVISSAYQVSTVNNNTVNSPVHQSVHRTQSIAV